MRDSRGAVAVALSDAQMPREDESFLDTQVRQARAAAGLAASTLAAACRGSTPPDHLSALAQVTLLAAAELRMALRARGLTPQ